ncbi:MoaD/ThiS family protein [Nannocystaceae bacterium ST9]
MPTVRIPTPLRKYTQGLEQVEVQGSVLRDVLQRLDSDYAGIGERIRDDKGEIRRFVNVFVGDEDVRFLQGLDTPVGERDEVSIIPAIAGG